MLVIVDLDNNSIRSVINDFERAEEYIPGKSIIAPNVLSRNEHVVCPSCDLTAPGKFTDSYSFVAFYDDLEAAAGIIHGDEASDQIRKIKQYIDSNQDVITGVVEYISMSRATNYRGLERKPPNSFGNSSSVTRRSARRSKDS